MDNPQLIEAENKFLDNYEKFRNKKQKKIFQLKDRSDIYTLQKGKHL
jgi:hypothetical protein